MHTNDRQSIRRRVNDAARIVYACGHSVVCRIRDISDTGAGIVTPDGRQLPETFRLEDGDRTARPVRLVWHAMRNAGVVFTDWGRREPKRGFGKRDPSQP